MNLTRAFNKYNFGCAICFVNKKVMYVKLLVYGSIRVTVPLISTLQFLCSFSVRGKIELKIFSLHSKRCKGT